MFKNIPGVEEFRERHDELTASRMRQSLGVAGSLVSWSSQGEGLWLARLSGPDLAETIEAVGKRRVEAIQEAELIYARRQTTALEELPNLGPEV